MQFVILLSRTLGKPLSVIMEMQSADYELYKAEFERCPWDRDFRQSKDEFVDAPSADDLNNFLGNING